MRKLLFQCVSCGYQASVTAGTIFQDTRKPLRLWFRMAWWLTGQKTGASALGLQQSLGLGSYTTAWTWLHKLRRAMVRPGRDRLSGKLEVDETYVTCSSGTVRCQGKTRKALVVIAVEERGKGIGRIRMKAIDNASAKTLREFITETIQPGSVIHTDGCDGYAWLAGSGYYHDATVMDGRQAELAVRLLPRVHLVAALLKRWLLGTHQGAVSYRYLDYYLDEFTFRFNRRGSRHRGKLFYRLLQQAVAIDPVPHKEITR